MKTLIYLEDAIDAIEHKLSEPAYQHTGEDWYVGMNCAESELYDLPFAEPERKTGRWIPVDSFSAFGGDEEAWMSHGNPVAFYYCSECKEHAYVGEDGEDLLTNYCPNCGSYNGGAKMEEPT